MSEIITSILDTAKEHFNSSEFFQDSLDGLIDNEELEEDKQELSLYTQELEAIGETW